MEIKDLLLRLGTENLIKFIDDDLFRILQIRNKSILKQKNFTETILKLFYLFVFNLSTNLLNN